MPTQPTLPPFSPQQSFLSEADAILQIPTFVSSRSHRFRTQDLMQFLRFDLETPKVDQVLSYLWFAAEPAPARPLFRYQLMDRKILLTEFADEHVVSDDTVLFVKPLREYLFSHDFWSQHLCSDLKLYQAACGMLFSYTWIVAFRSDFEIARKLGLIPEFLDWTKWTAFVNDFLDHVQSPHVPPLSERYSSGELRLRRLNLYKLHLRLFSFKNTMNGFTWYRPFVQRNLGNLAIFAFFTLVLSAMQGGLAKTGLQTSAAYAKLCYGFAIFSMVVALFSALAMVVGHLFPMTYRLVRKRLSNRNKWSG